MQAKMCSRCGKNVAVVFITKLEGGVQKNEGLCLKCARELHIKPVDDMIEKMGISDEDLDNLSGEMMNALNGVESLMDMSIDPDNDATTIPMMTARPQHSRFSTDCSETAITRLPRATMQPRSSRPRRAESRRSASSWTITA